MAGIGLKILYDQLSFLKSKSEKPSEEDCTLYSVGYKDGVTDAMIAIKNRFEIFK